MFHAVSSIDGSILFFGGVRVGGANGGGAKGGGAKGGGARGSGVTFGGAQVDLGGQAEADDVVGAHFDAVEGVVLQVLQLVAHRRREGHLVAHLRRPGRLLPAARRVAHLPPNKPHQTRSVSQKNTNVLPEKSLRQYKVKLGKTR